MNPPRNKFTPDLAIADYRRVIADRDSQTTAKGRAEYDAVLRKMRKAWAAWQGEDSLHEMAVGEPVE